MPALHDVGLTWILPFKHIEGLLHRKDVGQWGLSSYGEAVERNPWGIGAALPGPPSTSVPSQNLSHRSGDQPEEMLFGHHLQIVAGLQMKIRLVDEGGGIEA